MLSQPAIIAAVAAGLDRHGATQCRARPGDGRDVRRPAARAGRGRHAAPAAHPEALARHAQPARGRGAARRADWPQTRPRCAARRSVLRARPARRADQGRPRRRRRRASTCWSTPRASRASPRRASRPATRTAPAARCRPRSPPGSPRASRCARRSLRQSATSAPPSRRPTRFAIGHGHGPVHHFHGLVDELELLPPRRARPRGGRSRGAGGRSAGGGARRGAAALAHGHLVAEGPRRPRRVGEARRRAHQRHGGRAAADRPSSPPARSCRRSKCSTRSRRHRRDRPHGVVLLAGQDPGGGFFTTVPFGLTPVEHVAWIELRRRPGAVGRALRAVRRQAVHGRQHRRLMGGWFRQKLAGPDDLKGMQHPRRWGSAARSSAGSARRRMTIAAGDLLPACESRLDRRRRVPRRRRPTSRRPLRARRSTTRPASTSRTARAS